MLVSGLEISSRDIYIISCNNEMYLTVGKINEKISNSQLKTIMHIEYR